MQTLKAISETPNFLNIFCDEITWVLFLIVIGPWYRLDMQSSSGNASHLFLFIITTKEWGIKMAYQIIDIEWAKSQHTFLQNWRDFLYWYSYSKIAAMGTAEPTSTYTSVSILLSQMKRTTFRTNHPGYSYNICAA